MVGRSQPEQGEAGFTLPVLERILTPPRPDLVATQIDNLTAPGDVVIDLFGRGGWVARAAIDRRRGALSLETGPLGRLLAEIVLRPPDLRHLDASFGALGASPHGDSSLRAWIGDLFATRCATCSRPTAADEIGWGRSDDGPLVATDKRYRCTVCRDQRGGGEQRRAPLDEADQERAARDVGAASVRRALRDRFPMPPGAEPVADQILSLHTDRQLIALVAILDRIEGELRAAPIVSALRLAFIGAIVPASRLNVSNGRPAALRFVDGAVRAPTVDAWRERNPWVAFEESYRQLRGFVQRIEGAALGPIQARLGEDLRSLSETTASVVLRVASPSALRALARETGSPGRRTSGGAEGEDRSPVRLVIGQPPPRPTPERLAATYHLTAWGLGREAASMMPLDAVIAPPERVPAAWQAAIIRRSLEAVAPLLSRDGRAVLLLEDVGAEALVAATLAGVGAGFRLEDARLAGPGDPDVSRIALIAPGGVVPPGPRTRAHRALPALRDGPGDPDIVPGAGLFAPPERFDARPFDVAEFQRSVTDILVDVLKIRGEPARTERLFGEILIGLDRNGLLRRFASSASPAGASDTSRAGDRSDSGPGRAPDPSLAADAVPADDPASPAIGPSIDADRGDDPAAGSDRSPGPARSRDRSGPAATSPGTTGAPEQPHPSVAHHPGRARESRRPDVALDPVERLVALIRDELSRPTNRRIEEIEPERWWLADSEDRAAAGAPLADRLEWAVYSLLSTAGTVSERTFLERIATMFSGPDLPDEALVRACLESYRSPSAGSEAIRTDEDIRDRTREHTELLIALADGGHRLGMNVWLARSEQSRRIGSRTVQDWLDERERRAFLPGIQRAASADLEVVDCMWYVRHGATFLWEVEWTAMLHDTVVRRHGRIPAADQQVRLLVVPPERAALIKVKLERSPVLRGAMTEGNWHIIKSSHLRRWLATDPIELAALEPYIGLDAPADRGGDQMALFDPGKPTP